MAAAAAPSRQRDPTPIATVQRKHRRSMSKVRPPAAGQTARQKRGRAVHRARERSTTSRHHCAPYTCAILLRRRRSATIMSRPDCTKNKKRGSAPPPIYSSAYFHLRATFPLRSEPSAAPDHPGIVWRTMADRGKKRIRSRNRPHQTSPTTDFRQHQLQDTNDYCAAYMQRQILCEARGRWAPERSRNADDAVTAHRD